MNSLKILAAPLLILYTHVAFQFRSRRRAIAVPSMISQPQTAQAQPEMQVVMHVKADDFPVTSEHPPDIRRARAISLSFCITRIPPFTKNTDLAFPKPTPIHLPPPKWPPPPRAAWERTSPSAPSAQEDTTFIAPAGTPMPRSRRCSVRTYPYLQRSNEEKNEERS